jgi:deoxycytidine triphosphate deaminase
MSVLSNIDIERELVKGKNLIIHPLNLENIKGSTYNLTASNLAWRLSDKESAVVNNEIVIPALDSVLIQTEEVIWVSEKICGTYHSKVKWVSLGSGHIGTTLDPEWIGQSLITLHNHSNNEIRIPVGKTFASIMFYYLNSRSTKEINANVHGRPDIWKNLKLTREEEESLDEDWKKSKSLLLQKMRSSDSYKALAEKHNLKKEKFKTASKWTAEKIIIPLILSVIGGIVGYLLKNR